MEVLCREETESVWSVNKYPALLEMAPKAQGTDEMGMLLL